MVGDKCYNFRGRFCRIKTIFQKKFGGTLSTEVRKMNWKDLLKPVNERSVNYKNREGKPMQNELGRENDHRTIFKRDFDTICRSPSLRRLQDKAQVFPLERHDHIRTRLTHSLEVMSVAESLGEDVIGIILEKDPDFQIDDFEERERFILSSQIRNIPTILKSAALIHDLGNPPFGHLGEDVIREWFENNLGKLFYNEEERRIFRAGSSDGLHRNIREILGDLTQDFECFDGNAQTFRTVAKLERLGNMPYGMSLSFPLLATIIKYPNGSEPAFGNGIHKKKGTYYAEKGLYDQIQKELHLDHSRHPLAFLLEAADDIAYYTADLEDAGKKRLISSDCFLSAYDAFLRKIENDESGDDRNPAYLQKMKSLREEFDIIMKKDGAELESETTIMKRFMLQARGMLISGVKIAFREHYDSIMKGELTESLLDVSDCKTIKNFLQKMLFDKVYYCKEIIRNKIEAQKIISGLLSVLTESSVNAPEKPEDKTDYLISSLISLNYRKVFSDSQNTDDFDAKLYLYNKILMVLDTIAGMTDSFAKEVYELVR